ncbi:MAG TPA: hypothetical protein VJJ01_00445 [Nitrosopumilaceae archaeon]|nr:hypothetical protein [Nitrosopumilaceae archaeon]
MVKLPHYVQVANRIEFARLVCALERVPRTSFSFEHEGQYVISVQMDLLKERPIIYYTPAEKSGHYLSYGFKAGNEDSSIVNTITNPTYLYSPIVRVKSLPPSLKQETQRDLESVYDPLELEDLASLVNLSYGFEESPFPLFAFSDGNKWLLGVFMNFNESDKVSYFCHVTLNIEPTKPFLKYSSKDGAEPSFASSVSEHGYSYLKVIKLKDKHPLVKL